MILKLLHTADWHLGKSFAGFSGPAQATLKRARLEVLDRVFGAAELHGVDAVLCAGDLFDDPFPQQVWWEGLLAVLSRTPPTRPIYLLPGNHDALVPGSIWRAGTPFRAKLPAHAHVIDQPNTSFSLGEGAVLIASPCHSQAGQDDLAMALPARAAGDDSIRVGMVHGSTFDLPNHQSNFPIAQDAAVARGFDYLAIGDTHGFRIVPEDAPVPIVYPGAPEQTRFEEKGAGSVALVLVRRNRRVTVTPERVGRWTWRELTVKTMPELRQLAGRTDLKQTVLRLRLELRLNAAEFEEAQALLTRLQGTEAVAPAVGILKLEASGVELDTHDLDDAFKQMPAALQEALHRLRALEVKGATDGHGPGVVGRALYHLYTLARKIDAASGKAGG